MKSINTKTSFLGLAALLLMTPVAAYAGADSGFYLGGGVGESSVDSDYSDDTDTAYKVFGGYNIGFIPLVDFAVEASYVDFGSPGTDVTGFDGYGLAGLSFGPIGVFVKAGTIRWDTDDDSGTDPAYGIGARFALGSISVRAEYEEFDVDEVDEFSMTSVSAVFTF